MSNGASLSVMGLYKYNHRLFDKMKFPEGFTDQQKEIIINNIIVDTAGLECAYPNWDIMQSMIEIWSLYNLPAWNRIYKLSLIEYNPIENYNRNETETIKNTEDNTHNDSDRMQASGTDSSNSSQTNFGTDTTITKRTAYDSNTPKTHDESSLNYGHNVADSGSTTYGRADTRTRMESSKHTGEIIKSNHTSGNIGVTTSQQMAMSEIELATAINIYPIICNSFKERFCVLVY